MPDTDAALDTSRDTASDTTSDVRDSGPPPPCLTTAPTACPDPMPTYDEVEPLIAERCVTCHDGLHTNTWPLSDYQHVSDWKDTIRSAMLDCSMPPPEERLPMSTEERMLILEWLRCRLPH